MAKQSDPVSYTLTDLKTIVAAGMPIGEARALLQEGYDPADVLELATLQAAQTAKAAIDAQKATAEAMHKAANPSNPEHPGRSAFSYPEGDVAKPRPVLPFEFFYNAYPMHKFPETEHWRELELASLVTPGEYTVLRKDGSKMKTTVKGETDADGKVTKIILEFPVLKAEAPLVPPKAVLLYQIVHSKTKTPRQAFLEAMQEHLLQTLGAEDAVGV
jgi:hypothetical protein